MDTNYYYYPHDVFIGYSVILSELSNKNPKYNPVQKSLIFQYPICKIMAKHHISKSLENPTDILKKSFKIKDLKPYYNIIIQNYINFIIPQAIMFHKNDLKELNRIYDIFNQFKDEINEVMKDESLNNINDLTDFLVYFTKQRKNCKP